MAFPLIPVALIAGLAYFASKAGGGTKSSTDLTKGGGASNPNNDAVITQDEMATAFKDVPEPYKTTMINAISYATKDQIPQLKAMADGLEKSGNPGAAAAAALIRRRIDQLAKL